MQVSDHLHTLGISIVIDKPTRMGPIRSYRQVRIRVRLPWAFRHDKGSSGENGSDDTLNEQGDSPRPVGFDEGRKVIDPLETSLRMENRLENRADIPQKMRIQKCFQ